MDSKFRQKAAMLPITFLNVFNYIVSYATEISVKFISEGSIGNKSALVHNMA